MGRISDVLVSKIKTAYNEGRDTSVFEVDSHTVDKIIAGFSYKNVKPFTNKQQIPTSPIILNRPELTHNMMQFVDITSGDQHKDLLAILSSMKPPFRVGVNREAAIEYYTKKKKELEYRIAVITLQMHAVENNDFTALSDQHYQEILNDVEKIRRMKDQQIPLTFENFQKA